jgi:hypothetical protein
MSDEQQADIHEEAADARAGLAREAVACPDCTAQRGEYCRDRTGAEVPTHPQRVAVYGRDFGARA